MTAKKSKKRDPMAPVLNSQGGSCENCVQYHTSPDVPMTALLRTTLRMRPDRILVGEVRGAEALDLLGA